MAERRLEVAAGAILENDDFPNKILFVVEAHADPKTGKVVGAYSIPAGFVRDGEPLSKAVAREVREETGYKHITLLNIVGLYQVTGGLGVVFLGRVWGGVPNHSSSEISEVKWLNPRAVLVGKNAILREGMVSALRHYLQGRRFPLDILTDCRK